MRSFFGSLLGWFFRRIGSQLARAIMRRRWVLVVAFVTGAVWQVKGTAVIYNDVSGTVMHAAEYRNGNIVQWLTVVGGVNDASTGQRFVDYTAIHTNIQVRVWLGYCCSQVGSPYITIDFADMWNAYEYHITGPGAPPVQYTNCYLTKTITSDSSLYETLTVAEKEGNNAWTYYSTNLPPRGSHTITMQGTNCPLQMTWQFMEGPSGSMSSTNWVQTNTVPQTSSSVSVAYTGDTVPLTLPGMTNIPAPLTVPAQTGRGTNYSDATTATRTMDSNQDRRFAELEQLLVSQSQAERVEANADAKQQADMANRAHADAQALKGVFDGNVVEAWDFGSITGAAPVLLLNTNFVVSQATQNKLKSRLPQIGSVGSTPLEITLPLHSVHAGLADYSLALSDSKWSSTFGYVRAFLLLLVTLGFLVASFKLLRDIAPN